MSRERHNLQRPRPLTEPKATCAVPSCEALTLCRGRRPHHAQRECVGTWETSSGPPSRCDGGPQREPYGARRWGTDEESDALHSTGEALEQSRDERWRRAWREGSAVGGKASSNACSGHRAGLSMSPTRRAYGSKRDHRYGLARRSRPTFDRSPVRESRTPGTVRGAVSNHRPYRDPYFIPVCRTPDAIACFFLYLLPGAGAPGT